MPSTVNQFVEVQVGRVYAAFTNFAATDALAAGATSRKLTGDILPKAGVQVAGDDIGGGDVADDPVDTAEAGNVRFDVGEEVDKLLFGVRLVFTALPVLVERRVS